MAVIKYIDSDEVPTCNEALITKCTLCGQAWQGEDRRFCTDPWGLFMQWSASILFPELLEEVNDGKARD